MCSWPTGLGRGLVGWGLIAKIDAREAHAPVRQIQWLMSMLGLVGIVVVLGLVGSYTVAPGTLHGRCGNYLGRGTEISRLRNAESEATLEWHPWR